MARPIASVYVDIAEFLAETMDVIQDNPEESDRALGAWTRRLAKGLARRDPSIHPYAAKLLEDAAKFMASTSEKNKAAADERWRKEREKANASDGMRAHAGASGRNANDASERSGRSDQEDQNEEREGSPVSPKGGSQPQPPGLGDRTLPEFTAKVIGYLNQKTGREYRGGKAVERLIAARLREGFKPEDFRTVINNMSAHWLGDPKMEAFLRPLTLFGTKFDGYLNQGDAAPAKNGKPVPPAMAPSLPIRIIKDAETHG